MTHNNQKKIAAINDISGFGRCSITVTLPIVSAMKIQCCPVPTSIFSNHTGFPEFFFEDYSTKMQDYIDNWKKLGLRFDGITSGFLGSENQIDIVKRFINDFKEVDTVVLIDPVMGDYGKTYTTYTKQMCIKMKELVRYATILTPNLTEACILTDTPYNDGSFKTDEIIKMAERLSDMGPEKVVITGIPQKSFIANLCFEKGEDVSILRTGKVGVERSGTGDVFSSIVIADAVNDVEFKKSVKKASDFIKACIIRSDELDIPTTDGVCFEEFLHRLK